MSSNIDILSYFIMLIIYYNTMIFFLAKSTSWQPPKGSLVAHLAGTLTQLRSLLPETQETQEVPGANIDIAG